MDTLIMVSIMTLVLLASSGSARAATLILSNQMQARGNVPVFVTCVGGSPRKMFKSVPLGQVSLIEIPPTGGQNATDDISPTAGQNDKPAGSIVSQLMSCVGTFKSEAHFWPSEMTYSLYNPFKDSTVCKNVCVVVAKDDGFYRWNNDKNAWDIIPRRIFI